MSQIKKFREKAGLTQRALAAQIGVAEITVRKWEKAKRMPRIESIRAMAKVFDCPPAKLL